MASTLSISAFQTAIASGSLRPTYLLLGRDNFLINSCVTQLIDKLLAPDERSLNLSQFYGNDADRLMEELDTPPLFSGNRIVLVRQAETLKPNLLTELSDFLKDPPSGSCLILTAGEPDKRKAFFKNIAPLLTQVLCNPPRVNELAKWAADYLSKQEKTFDKEAMNSLMAVDWPNMGELAGEIDKLALMVGDSQTIKASDIEEAGGLSFAYERWKLTDAVGGGDVAGSVKAVENLMQWGIKPTQIVGDLFRLFWNLWVIKGYMEQKNMSGARKVVHLPQFVFERYNRFVQRIPIKRVGDGIIRLEEADLNIKRGLKRPDLEVSLLATDLSRMLRSE